MLAYDPDLYKLKGEWIFQHTSGLYASIPPWEAKDHYKNGKSAERDFPYARLYEIEN